MSVYLRAKYKVSSITITSLRLGSKKPTQIRVKGTKISIFENFSQEEIQIRTEKWKEVLPNRK